MIVPVMAKRTRNGQFRLHSRLKNTGHGSNFLIFDAFSASSSSSSLSKQKVVDLAQCGIVFEGNESGFNKGFSPETENSTVLFERLPVVIPIIDPVVYAFQEFSFRWRQQYRRRYLDELLDKSTARQLMCLTVTRDLVETLEVHILTATEQERNEILSLVLYVQWGLYTRGF
ncbi:hypothetical protein ACLB2K_071608 [Fragaria x ananassa]